MLNGKREGWIEASIIVDGNSVDAEPRLVGAVQLIELKVIRRRLLEQPSAKSEGVDLADGDIVVDFHRDEQGEDGGIESYVLDPVAFSTKDALKILPDIIGIPRSKLLAHIERYLPSALSGQSNI